ncbi:MAG TPA: hypothetical protein VIR57_12255 [Chloroflexota bacterium]
MKYIQKAMAHDVADPCPQPAPSGPASFWGRLKLVGLIVVGIILAALGGIGVALGLMQSPSG